MQDTTHTTPPPPPPPVPPAPRVLRRREGHLGGVAAGVGHYLDLDPNLVRVGFVVASLLGGTGVFLYLAGWILIPTIAEDASAQPITLRTDSSTVIVGGIVLVLAALAFASPFDGDGGLLLPLALVVLGAWLLNQRPGGGAQPAVTGTPAGGGPAPATPAPGTGGTGHPGAPTAGPRPGGADPTTGGEERWPVPWQPGSTAVEPSAEPVQAEGWSRSTTEVERYPAPAVEGPGHFRWEPEHDLADVDAGSRSGSEAGARIGSGTMPHDAGDVPPWSDGTTPPPPPPGGTAHGWAVPHGRGEPARPAPTGPPVTSITLAVLAITIGVLLVLDSADAIDLTVVAVAATSLAVIGCGLLAGAFLGRAKGLIPLGLLALLGLAVAPAADFALEGGIADRVVRVDDEAALQDRYRVGLGSLLVDLRDLDAEALDRELEVEVGIGVVEVIVPDGVRVEVDGRSGAGYVELFGREEDGMGAELRTVDGPSGEDVLVLEADARIGAVIVRRG